MSDQGHPSRGGRVAQPRLGLFHRRSEIHGQVVKDESYVGADARRSNVVGSLFRNCRFEECDFRRADFEGSVFEGCTFERCDFSSVDFRSCELANCKVVDCTFSGGSMRLSKVLASEIRGSKFDRQMVEEGSWRECEFVSATFRRSTLLHCDFAGCRFDKVDLANCTSLYHFFDRCEFSDTRVNIDTIAYSFGLSLDNLDSVKLVWMGITQKRTERGLSRAKAIFEAVAHRRWSVAVCSMAINFGLRSTVAAFRIVFSSLQRSEKPTRSVRPDDMKFISRLIDVIVASNAMPLLAVIDGLDSISTAIRKQRLLITDNLKILALSLKDAELRILQTWESTLVRLDGMQDAIVDVEITYEDKPTFETLDVLARVAETLGGPSPTYLGGRSGSYIEVLKMGIETVLGLAICAGLLVRIIDSMIKIRAKSEILFAPRLPSIVRTTALQPLPSTSTELLNYVALCKTIAADPTSSVTLAMPEFGEKLRGIEVGPMDKSRARVRKRGGAGPLALGDHTAED